jgi:hypothetical protein
MGGVDRSDQMISYTNNVVKSFKWWKMDFGLVYDVKCHFSTIFQ